MIREAGDFFFKNSDLSSGSNSIQLEENDLTKTTATSLATSFLEFVNTEDEADDVLEKQGLEQASIISALASLDRFGSYIQNNF